MARKSFALELGSVDNPDDEEGDSLTENVVMVSDEAKELAKGLPSPHASDLRAKLRKRTQMNFPRIPVFIKEEFDAAAKKNKMMKVEFLYHCLRVGGGLDIPPYDQLDLRKT